MDQAFAELLSPGTIPGTNPISTMVTSGNDHFASVTDRVRIRSVIESTRIVAIDTSAKKKASAEVQDVSESFTDTDYEGAISADEFRQETDSFNMSISKMYERSLTILGDSLE
jgi:Subunit 11 of the general transcription factor TFIIH